MHEESIFFAALEKRTPAERQAYLESACASDAELRRRLEALLKAHEQSGDLLDSPANLLRAAAKGADTLLERPLAGTPEAIIDKPSTESPGTVIGPYKLIEQIGDGGMGNVWMAQQTEPVKRLVAVKLIKAGMDSR